jgi:hypothetical protein
MLMPLCAGSSIETWVWPSKQNSSGTVCPTYSGEFFAHHHTRAKSSRPCTRLVAWLRCCSYANKFVNTFPLCGFVNWYPIMRLEAGALNVHPSQLERKSIRARQNNYKKPKWFNLTQNHSSSNSTCNGPLYTLSAISLSFVRRNSDDCKESFV